MGSSHWCWSSRTTPPRRGCSRTTLPRAASGRRWAVDDDPSALDLLDRILGPAGYTMLRAETGEEAVKIARTSPPDVLLLDLVMPGMSGFEVVSALQDEPATARIPILIVTSKDLTVAEKEELNGRVEAVLHKGSLARVDILTWLKELEGRTAEPVK